MRVLAVIDSLDASGGAERSFAALAPALVAGGVDLHVASLRDRPRSVAGDLEAAGATVHRVAGAGGRPGDAVRLYRLAAALRPDLVHTTLFDADVAGRAAAVAARRPVVGSLVNVAYGGDEAPPGVAAWKLRAARELDAATARAVRRFHAITAHVADVMAPRLRIPRDRIDVVARGRDPAVLGRRSPARRLRSRLALGLDDTQPVVLAIGRQEWQKGHDTLVAATAMLTARHPDLVVLVAGRPGNRTGALAAEVAAAGVATRVRFLGFRDDVADLLCAADVFAFPSRWEGLGSTLLEAMALEAPIVASCLPAVREVLTPDEARLVAPSDPVALAAAIAETIDDADGARRRALAARRHFLAEFTVDASARGMRAFYERALGERRR
jgi:glycosyltransferase involved in cell wall biosynthesis